MILLVPIETKIDRHASSSLKKIARGMVLITPVYVSARMDQSRGRAWGGSDFALVQIQGQNANTDTVQIPLQIQPSISVSSTFGHTYRSCAVFAIDVAGAWVCNVCTVVSYGT